MKAYPRGRFRALPPLAVALWLGGCRLALLDPKGRIGADERSLILTATGLMLIVVIPAIVLTLVFAWRYRASNLRAKYMPEWAHSSRIEAVVWGVPCLIVLAMGVLAWKTTHELDPYRPIAAAEKPLRIDVVAMDWKWLFIYPDQGIAAVNRMVVPVGVPLAFRVTSDSVMTSFFIPRLGSQIYAMAGMTTRLHLIADEAGSYDGMAANYSGRGFSGMKFKADAASREAFDAWIAAAAASANRLTPETFPALAKPSENHPVTYYAAVDPGLFSWVVGRYPHGGGSAVPMNHQPAGGGR